MEIMNKGFKYNNLFQIKNTKNTIIIVLCLIIAFFIFMISKNIIFKPNNNDKLNDEKQDEINKAKSDLIEQIKNNLNKDKNKDTNKDINQIPDNLFYITQNKEEIKIDNFSSNQLRNPQNIKLIEKLEITLDLEYKNFVHLKIKDSSTKRWELPESDVLNKEYLNNRQNNILSASKKSSIITSNLFNIELNSINEFSFKLTNDESLEFYSFSTKKQFLYSDTYINFQSKLTSDNIYGFGERTHDFKLRKGIYTIWPHDCGGIKYDYGDGGMNQYSHQPIGLHKTKFKNLWLGFVFLNTNAQDVIISNEENTSNTFLTHKTIGGIIDYYIIVNNSPEEVVKNIQFLLGIPPLPPYWSFGYHQSRYGYKNFNEFREVYEKYKQ
jgi:alpha-glucosidase (family GH31 glycosyl hydrolase)